MLSTIVFFTVKRSCRKRNDFALHLDYDGIRKVSNTKCVSPSFLFHGVLLEVVVVVITSSTAVLALTLIETTSRLDYLHSLLLYYYTTTLLIILLLYLFCKKYTAVTIYS